MKNNIYDILEIIKKSENIAIAGHISPDADSLGSCFAMAYCLQKIGKNVSVLLNDFGNKYNVLPGFEFANKSINPDLFILMDCGDVNRVGNFLDLFKNTKSILIDHHINTGFADFNFIDEKSSSTCEVLYNIITNLCELDSNIATCLYAGIVTDTSGFRNSTTSKTMQIASELLKYDFDSENIYEVLMYKQSLHQFQGFMSVVADFKIDIEASIVYTIATKEKLENLNITKNDLDGIVNIFKRIHDIEVYCFAYELDNGATKISLRSHNFDVNNIAKFFGGGGHKLASACILNMSPNEAMEKIIEKLKQIV
ncbi:MAG: bifunctional oligoribonuclease/PAP phosphatase NrnA [Defluviitaleaceae bacterium]|nr:bifunctional oligoribonuclease/PAP phosphatase NrnA [Defluviitaleaceae bacterium]